MKTANANIYLDTIRPKANGKCSVKIKITFKGTRKYFSTGIDLTKEELEKVMTNSRRTKEQKAVLTKLNDFEKKAISSIEKLALFTFDAFEEEFLKERNVYDHVSFAFDKRIKELNIESRIGTAVSYQCAKTSIEVFKKNLTFAEVTPTFLKKYETSMLQNNKSVTTIGIYLRSLRAIYNLQNIDKSIYPFGEGKNKYPIPTGRNIKKALTIEEIARIYNYEAIPNSTKEMAKDYWLFLYLSNGMNVKDFCLLKWSNINSNMLTYSRAKTQRSKKENSSISVSLKSETFEIIKKWGQPSILKDAYIFPHLSNEMDAVKQRATCQQLTKIINKYVKEIANEVGIEKNVTSYFARHSFATVLKRSGVKTEMISELLGHSSTLVTQSYLGSFEDEQIQKDTDSLTIGFKKAN